MKCSSCSFGKIKNDNNCFIINDNTNKTFYDPEDSNKILSCKATYGKYIINNECIIKPEEGYFISNNVTGLLLPCHESCRTCSKSPSQNNSNCYSCKDNYLVEDGNCVKNCSKGYYQNNTQCFKCHQNCLTCDTGMITDSNGKLINMKCTQCSFRYLDISHELGMEMENMSKSLMIKNGDNCFPVVVYDHYKITFNLSEIYQRIENGNCLFFNKSIYSGENECIEKPENTFYILNNGENNGVIKNCSEACNTCFGQKLIMIQIVLIVLEDILKQKIQILIVF